MMTNTSEMDTDVLVDSENPMVRPSESDSTILKTFMKRSSLLAKQTMFEQAYTVYLLRYFMLLTLLNDAVKLLADLPKSFFFVE